MNINFISKYWHRLLKLYYSLASNDICYINKNAHTLKI